MATENACDSALQIVKKLVAKLPEGETRLLAKSIQTRIELPMSVVLDRLRGESVLEKAKAAKVTRATYYAWINGMARPKTKMARRLARLTGFPWQQIAGRPNGD